MWANPTRPLIYKLLGGAVCMFLFALFVMPPLYDMFCEVTGIGGKTSGPYVASEAGIDTSRTVKVQFVATNNAAMSWQFSPKVFNAASYFHKTECFCFNQQPLKAGEEADLPLVFIVDRDLPRAVKTITLSYTLFDITDRVNDGSVAKLN